jgi:hypothetical protein
VVIELRAQSTAAHYQIGVNMRFNEFKIINEAFDSQVLAMQKELKAKARR